MATLTVSISEELNLNGKDRGSVISKDISQITETFHRIMDVKTSGTQTILEMDATEGNSAGGKLFSTNVKYLRVTNLDNSNFVAITVQNDSTEEYMVKLEAGQSYVLFNSSLDANASGDSSSAAGNLTAIDNILARADSASCQVEVFAALT
jgi:4-aminobutyrate aminotransferase-like enzyme